MASDDSMVVDISSLDQEQQDLFFAKKLKLFKITIMVCAIYGTIAAAILIAMFYTQWGQRNLYKNASYFIATYILGTLFIIFYLIYLVASFKPTILKNNHSYDSDMCPDYWKLESITKESLQDAEGKDYIDVDRNTNLNRNHFKYKCSMEPTIFSPEKMKRKSPENYVTGEVVGSDLVFELDTQTNNTGLSDNQFAKMKEYASIMSGYSTKDGKIVGHNNANSVHKKVNNTAQYYSGAQDKIPLACDQVFPIYLSTMDKEYAKNNPSEPGNIFRCAYSKMCKVPWTEAGCSN